jgi:hypothetical protein
MECIRVVLECMRVVLECALEFFLECMRVDLEYATGAGCSYRCTNAALLLLQRTRHAITLLLNQLLLLLHKKHRH